MKGGKSKAEAPKRAESKLSVKKKASDKATSKPVKKARTGKDPNKPKRPPSAFFVFMEEFREQYKKKNPSVNKVSVIGKAGGDKWKTLSDADKAPYAAKASKLKAEYDKKMITYNKQEAGGYKNAEEEEGSEKSRSEVNDDEEGSEEEEEDDDDE